VLRMLPRLQRKKCDTSSTSEGGSGDSEQATRTFSSKRKDPMICTRISLANRLGIHTPRLTVAAIARQLHRHRNTMRAHSGRGHRTPDEMAAHYWREEWHSSPTASDKAVA